MTLEERYRQFQMMELPGQPRGIHMGTSYLMSDMMSEIKRLRDYIWSLDGKTICTRTDGDTFIDEGFIRAFDIVPLDNAQK